MSVDVCPRCPGNVWTKGYAKIGCDKCEAEWSTFTDYREELVGVVDNNSEYLAADLGNDLEKLVEIVRINTMREIGGRLMDVYEPTAHKLKTKTPGSKEHAAVEGELGALHTIMEWLSGWSNKIEKEMNNDDS